LVACIEKEKMKKYIVILFIFCGLSSCKKEETKHSVTYKVTVTKGHPTYSVTYSSTNNTTKSESSITSLNWTSKVDDRKDGDIVILTLEGGNGGSYKMYIYIDGFLMKESDMEDPYGPLTIDAEIRD
jgi:hypothetical protein